MMMMTHTHIYIQLFSFYLLRRRPSLSSYIFVVVVITNTNEREKLTFKQKIFFIFAFVIKCIGVGHGLLLYIYAIRDIPFSSFFMYNFFFKTLIPLHLCYYTLARRARFFSSFSLTMRKWTKKWKIFCALKLSSNPIPIPILLKTLSLLLKSSSSCL